MFRWCGKKKYEQEEKIGKRWHYIKVRAFKEVVVGWSWSGKALSGTDRMIAERWKADDAPFTVFSARFTFHLP